MAYDEGAAERIRGVLASQAGIEEKNMFGGLAFMLNGHMCVGVVGERLMLRVGKEQYDAILLKQYVSVMDFTGKALPGFVYIDAEGFSEDDTLSEWIDIAKRFVLSLPPK